MARSNLLDRSVTATEFRNHAGLYIDRSAAEPVVITKHNRPSRVLIDFEEYRLGNVVTQQLEALVVEQVKDVFAPAGEEIVEAEHLVAFVDEPLAKMRPNKPRATCD